MNTAAAELLGTFGSLGSREVLKDILRELIREEPEILLEALQVTFREISERIDFTQNESIKDRARIADLELLLGLEEEIKDPEDPYYLEQKERREELRQQASLIQDIQGNPEKSLEERLYDELQRSLSLKNRDIMNLFGWDKSNTMKATRLMQRMPEKYPDVVYEKVPGKNRVMRIHIKN
ncbi:hypothetical protein FTO70_03830 [Methanosarcina sp. KYL-1]|uniref:hypothetical protein n=1 Tax=Methanosarcina sp. KYL-1 TaxID=2602068 RepID=UPI0021007CCF|nr:hypothetical protein [Methanosarcina sp. KYL-1]MCQ1534833.1 hypothetical protein [Methanosarcina sp. KYL-1]